MSDIQPTIQNLISLLETQKAQFVEEIRSYPHPIPACDAQFNYLLEKRDHVSIELNRLHKLYQDDDTSKQGIIHFMKSSRFISRELE